MATAAPQVVTLLLAAGVATDQKTLSNPWTSRGLMIAGRLMQQAEIMIYHGSRNEAIGQTEPTSPALVPSQMLKWPPHAAEKELLRKDSMGCGKEAILGPTLTLRSGFWLPACI